MASAPAAPGFAPGRATMSRPTEGAYLVCALVVASAVAWLVGGYVLAPLATGEVLGGYVEFEYLVKAFATFAMQVVLLGVFLGARRLVAGVDGGRGPSAWWSFIAFGGPLVVGLASSWGEPAVLRVAYGAGSAVVIALCVAAVASTGRVRLGAASARVLRAVGVLLGSLLGVPAAAVLLVGGFTLL